MVQRKNTIARIGGTVGTLSPVENAVLYDDMRFLGSDRDSWDWFEYDHDAKYGLGMDTLWIEHGALALEKYIKAYPCTRARLWWLYQNKHGLRARLDDSEATPGSEDSPPDPDGYLVYGIHTMWKTPKEKTEIIFESQSVFLARHNLLNPDEKKFLRKNKILLEPERFGILPEEYAQAVEAIPINNNSK